MTLVSFAHDSNLSLNSQPHFSFTKPATAPSKVTVKHEYRPVIKHNDDDHDDVRPDSRTSDRQAREEQQKKPKKKYVYPRRDTTWRKTIIGPVRLNKLIRITC